MNDLVLLQYISREGAELRKEKYRLEFKIYKKSSSKIEKKDIYCQFRRKYLQEKWKVLPLYVNI